VTREIYKQRRLAAFVSAGAAAPHLGKQLAKLGPKGRERDGRGTRISQKRMPHCTLDASERLAASPPVPAYRRPRRLGHQNARDSRMHQREVRQSPETGVISSCWVTRPSPRTSPASPANGGREHRWIRCESHWPLWLRSGGI